METAGACDRGQSTRRMALLLWVAGGLLAAAAIISTYGQALMPHAVNGMLVAMARAGTSAMGTTANAGASAARTRVSVAHSEPLEVLAAREVLAAWHYPPHFHAAPTAPPMQYLQSPNARCLVRISYTHATRTFSAGEVTPACWHVGNRVPPLLAWLDLSLAMYGNWSQPPHIASDFSFYMDVIDWCLASERPLDVPTVGVTRLPADNTSIVLPDPYMYGATLWHHTKHPAGTEMGDLFDRVYFGVPTPPAWRDKPAKLVYRGSCSPTRVEGHGIGAVEGHLRASTCAALADRNATFAGAIDFGLLVESTYCTTDEGWRKPGHLLDMCQLCRRCPPHSTVYRGGTSGNKFQLVIDGFALAYDSTWSKLSSRSATFWQTLPNGQMNWIPWYGSVLVPGQHFIPVTAQGLEGAVNACLEDDRRCELIAEASYKQMQHYATPEVGLAYGAATMQHVWKMQQPA